MEDRVGIARVPIEIARLADDADADDVGVKRDVPEPALLRHVGDGRRALVQPRIAQRAFVVAPDRDLVEIGIAVLPLKLPREQRITAGGVDDDLGADLAALLAVLDVGAHADDARSFHQDVADGDALPHFDALLARVVEQHRVELGAPDLPGLRTLVFDGLKEIERLRHLARDRDELHAVLLRARRLAQPVDHTEAIQREPRVRNQRFADVIPRHRLAIERAAHDGRTRRAAPRRSSRPARRRSR